jgi:hypothetical protein
VSFELDRLYSLLPEHIRARDAEQGEPLKALLSVFAEQIRVFEEDLTQLYDDQFIETCDRWVVPYIGDLIRAQCLHPVTAATITRRAQAANTLANRRRKGTASVLEQLARDVTGWQSRVVEFFQVLAATQHIRHIRLDNLQCPDLRQWEPLEFLDTPFNTVTRTVDVRRIEHGRGKFNIPSVGIFVWRLRPYSLTDSPAYRRDDRRYFANPLGSDTQLYASPCVEYMSSGLGDWTNVPTPISRNLMHHGLKKGLYGHHKSFLLKVDGYEIERDDIVVCDLSDAEDGGWNYRPQSKYAIDPALGRIAIPEHREPPTSVCVSFYYGFSADMGGGEYPRESTFTKGLEPIEQVGLACPLGPLASDQPSACHASIQAAINRLDELGGGGVVEIVDSGRYEESPELEVPAGKHVEVRAAECRRPILVLQPPHYDFGHTGIGADLI